MVILVQLGDGDVILAHGHGSGVAVQNAHGLADGIDQHDHAQDRHDDQRELDAGIDLVFIIAPVGACGLCHKIYPSLLLKIRCALQSL